jgi:hypothetical protein
MAVNVHCKGNTGMAKGLGDNLWPGTTQQHKSSKAMPQIMESAIPQSSSLYNPMEVMAQHARGNRLAFDVLVLMDCTEESISVLTRVIYCITGVVQEFCDNISSKRCEDSFACPIGRKHPLSRRASEPTVRRAGEERGLPI